MRKKILCAIMALLAVLSLMCGCSVEVDLQESSNTTTSTESTDGKIGSTTMENVISTTEQAYNTAINLDKSKLKKSNRYKDGETTVSWSYEGLYFTVEDCEFINNSLLNPKGLSNQGAIYRAMAFILDDYNTELYSDYSNYSEILIGFTPNTMDDFLAYANNANKFISNEDSLINIMKALQQSGSVSGTFDYDKNQLGIYDFTINNLSECATDLKVSEEMLGYIIAFLDEYAPDITFDGNSCNIKYTSFE